MSRYKEERANEILAINLTKMVDREEQSYSSIEEMKKLPEWDCTISAMCQLAEEVENIDKDMLIKWLSKEYTIEEAKRDIEEANIYRCIVIDYANGARDIVKITNSSVIHLNPYNNHLYTKEQVEELLQKQRELCAENAECCEGAIVDLGFEITSAYVDKDSILNAKLEI